VEVTGFGSWGREEWKGSKSTPLWPNHTLNQASLFCISVCVDVPYILKL
jgi:hypothetical protein